MKRINGMLRVFGFAMAMLGGVVGVTLQKAHAQLKERLGGFGQQIATLHEMAPGSAPRRLFLNGMAFGAITLSTKHGVREALDRFQSLCQSVGALELPAEVRRQLDAEAQSDVSMRNGILRQEAGDEGYLACLDLGGALNGEGFLARLVELGKTGNLSSLGQLRYALARRKGDQTTLIVFWTEGDAKLGELFPKQGDAPGSDLWAVPRPSGAMRYLSAAEEGQPYGLAMYRVQGKPRTAVVADYGVRLRAEGWHTDATKSGTLVAEKEGRHVLVSIRDGRDGAVLVTLSDLG